MMPYRGAALPVVRLSRLFGAARHDARSAAPVRRRRRRRGDRHRRRSDRRPARNRRPRDRRPAGARRRHFRRHRSRRRPCRADPRPGGAGAADARAARPRDCRGGRSPGMTTGHAVPAIGSYILFTVAGTTYALPSGDVRHMEMIEDITRVPNAPAFVDGVVFSRGQVVPVVNLRARFGFERVPLDVRTRLIVVQSAGRLIGLVADAAREFVTIPADAIQPPQRSARRDERAVCRGHRLDRRSADSPPEPRSDAEFRGGADRRPRPADVIAGEQVWLRRRTKTTARATALRPARALSTSTSGSSASAPVR